MTHHPSISLTTIVPEWEGVVSDGDFRTGRRQLGGWGGNWRLTGFAALPASPYHRRRASGDALASLPGSFVSNERRTSLIRRLLKRQGAVTPSAMDQTYDPASHLLYGWIVDWLDEDLNGTRLLDAGCWNGSFGVYLRTRGADVGYVGVDLSQQALGYAHEIDRSLQVLRADLASQILPFPSATFDGVVLILTYEHLPLGTDSALIPALADVLKPGGWLFVITELNSILTPLDPAWPFGHRHYSPGDLESVFQRAGLDIEAMRINGGVWHCLEVIAFYVAKHIFRRRLHRPAWLRALTTREYEPAPRWLGSRLCFKCRRPAV